MFNPLQSLKEINNLPKFAKLYSKLGILYGNRRREAFYLLKEVMKKYKGRIKQNHEKKLSEKDIFLIAYPDHIRGKESPLKELYKYLNTMSVFTGVHILPPYESDNDGGYSVVDYLTIKKDFGSWGDIQTIGRKYRLILDFVLNHTSINNRWFQEFLKENSNYKDFYITRKEGEDWSMVYRPRATPLFHRFKQGEKKIEVWTTFSKEQVDLNYRNPKVLAKMVDVALYYALHNANILRLDAIGYVWKKENSPCINLEETYAFVEMLRLIFDIVAPHVLLLTETIVPFKENTIYLNHGSDITYNVALPMMLFHTLFSREGQKLASWINSLNEITKKKYLLNVISTHDGFSIPPVKDLLTKEEIEYVIDIAEKKGALFTMRSTPLEEQVYEINSTLIDMIKDKDNYTEEKFLLLHSVLLTIPGVPALYLNNVVLDENDYKTVKKTGVPRDVSRRKFKAKDVHLKGKKAHTQELLIHMINKRKTLKNLSPNYPVEASWKDGILTIKRGNFYAFHNFTENTRELVLSHVVIGEDEEKFSIELKPFSFYWIENKKKLF